MAFSVTQIEIPRSMLCGDPPERRFDTILEYESKVVLARGREKDAIFEHIAAVAQMLGVTEDDVRKWPSRIVTVISWPCHACGHIIYGDFENDVLDQHGKGCRRSPMT